MSKMFLPLEMSATLLVRLLAQQLYDGPGQALMELIRNAACAAMGVDVWDNKNPNIRIFVGPSSVTNSNLTLTVLDNGSGFTESSFKRYQQVGADIDSGSRHGGASQKAIGRFAAFSLNEKLASGDYSTGYYVVTRTEKSGPVKLISMIPTAIQQTKGMSVQTLQLSDPRVADFRNIAGSFSAVVIPHSVIKTTKGVQESVKWLLPRKPDLALKVTVNALKVQAPSLAEQKLLIDNSKVEVYLQKLEQADSIPAEHRGLWLCDGLTGIRVARITTKHFHPLICRPDITGDIFVPELIGEQNTNRNDLSPEFFRSAKFKRLKEAIHQELLPVVEDLVGDDNGFKTRNPITNALSELSALCDKVFGIPNVEDITHGLFTRPNTKTGKLAAERKPASKPLSDKPDKKTTEAKTNKNAGRPVQIGEFTILLFQMTLSENVLFEVDMANPNIVFFNPGYQVPVKEKHAYAEHVIMQLLYVVANNRFPYDAMSRAEWVGTTRAQLAKKKK